MAYIVGRCLLQERLDEVRMRQVDLADSLGISKQQINRYITGGRIMSYEVAKNVSAILNCDMDQLYEWIEVGNRE